MGLSINNVSSFPSSDGHFGRDKCWKSQTVYISISSTSHLVKALKSSYLLKTSRWKIPRKIPKISDALKVFHMFPKILINFQHSSCQNCQLLRFLLFDEMILLQKKIFQIWSKNMSIFMILVLLFYSFCQNCPSFCDSVILSKIMLYQFPLICLLLCP